MIKLLVNSGIKVDTQLRRYYKPLILLLCIFSFVNFIRVDYVLTQNWNGWAVGDWLLNYQDGFIRRGLLGTVLIEGSKHLGIPINHFIYITQCSVFFLFLLTFYFLLRKKLLNFWFLILCLGPGFLLFNYYDGMSVGRKEILLYLIFGWWCLITERRQPPVVVVFVFAILIFVLTLSHEMVIFFIPYFIIAQRWLYPLQLKNDFDQSVVLAISSLAGVCLLLIFARPITENTMCATFLKLGAEEEVCKGIVSFGTDSSWRAFLFLIYDQELKKQFLWISFLPIIVLPFYLTILSNWPKLISGKKFLYAALSLFIFSAPLFLISIDWGRWIAIHITLCIILLTQKLPQSVSKRPLKHLHPTHSIFDISMHKATLVALMIVAGSIFVFNLSYSFNHCCTNNLLELLGPLKKFSTTISQFIAF